VRLNPARRAGLLACALHGVAAPKRKVPRELLSVLPVVPTATMGVSAPGGLYKTNLLAGL